MKLSNWWHKYKLQTILATWTLASIASLLGLVLNRNLYFTYYNPAVVIQFNESVSADAIERVSSHSNLATLDRAARVAKFQYIEEPELVSAMTDAGIQGSDYKISQIKSHYFNDGWYKVAWGGVVALAISAVAAYYFGGSALWKRNRIWVAGLALNFLFAAVYAFLLQMGWLSWSSRLVEISEFGIQSVLFAGLWTAIIAFVSVQKVFLELREIKTFREIMQTLSGQSIQFARTPLLGWATFVIGIGLVSLPRFGFDLLTLFVAGVVGLGVNVVVPQFMIQVLNLVAALPNWRKLKFKLPRRKVQTQATKVEPEKSKKKRKK